MHCIRVLSLLTLSVVLVAGTPKGTVDIIVSFGSLQKLPTFSESRGESIRLLTDVLKSHALESQANIHNFLKKSSNAFKSSETLWITNEISIKGAHPALVKSLEFFPEVIQVREDIPVSLLDYETVEEKHEEVKAEWNMEMIQAPQVWAMGYTGRGVTVGSVGTGVRWTHEALRTNYVTSHGWFDPSGRTPSPNDGVGVDTHIMGILVGTTQEIGVAPGATWMACKACTFSCAQADILSCGQFMLCPTDASGNNPECSRAPHIVVNSWGAGGGQSWFNPVAAAWRNANITGIFPIGSSGPNCNTAGSPGDGNDVLGIGSVGANNAVTSASSAGPSSTGAIKPDFVAPGASIRSAWNTADDAYQMSSGTSLAGPHVGGVAALLQSASGATKLTLDRVKSYLIAGAEPTGASGRTCGGIPETTYPNNVAGHGRVNALLSIQSLLSKH